MGSRLKSQEQSLDLMAEQYDDDEMQLCDFLESFPTYHIHSKPKPRSSDFWVFSSKDEQGYQNYNYSSSSADVGTQMINEKIKSAFSKLDTRGSWTIVQFWAPETIEDNKRILSTSGQPFAVDSLDECLKKYRQHCEEYEYNIENMNEQDEDYRPEIINCGTPAEAFLSRFPELVDNKEDPLMRFAPEEEMFSYMMPIYQTSSSSTCIGVVECSSYDNDFIFTCHQISRALKEEGLAIFNVREHIPYKTINGLKGARDEIQAALKNVCESHHISLAQVWISYEDVNHMPSLSSLEDIQTKRMLALKLTGYTICYHEDSTDYDLRIMNYYDTCDMVPLKKGDELVEKTLQDYESRFCEQISHLTPNLTAHALIVGDDDVETSVFVICMRSIETGDFSYAFEFMWIHNSTYENVIFLEALLLRFKRYLPRFKFASGTDLGDQLQVIDVHKSIDSETIKFKIFQPEAMEKGKKAIVIDYNAPSKEKRNTKKFHLSREDIEQHYGKTMKEAAQSLGVSLSTLKRNCGIFGMPAWQGPVLSKRKTNNSYNKRIKQRHSTEKDNGAIQDPLLVTGDDYRLTIKAEYGDNMTRFHLDVSEATFITVVEEIGRQFKLTPGTYNLKYIDDDGDLLILDSDQNMRDCIESLKMGERTLVRVRVLPSTK